MEGALDIPGHQPVLFNDCDHLFVCQPFYEFCREGKFAGIDGGLLTFKSNDPRFSFVSYDGNGNVNHTVEKQAVSGDAICGAYYFRDREVFQDAAELYLDKCLYNEFFVSGVYNILAEQGKRVISFPVEEHVSFGTPEEYEEAKMDLNYKKLM